MDFLAKVVLNLLRSLFLFNRATKKIPIHAPKPFRRVILDKDKEESDLGLSTPRGWHTYNSVPRLRRIRAYAQSLRASFIERYIKCVSYRF